MKSMRNIGGQQSRLLQQLGRELDNTLDADRRQQLTRRMTRTMRAGDRYSNNIRNYGRDGAAFDEFARRRTGDYSRDSRLRSELGLEIAETTPYPRSVYMGQQPYSQWVRDTQARARNNAQGLNAG